MKKILIFLSLCLSFSFADSALLLKKGWQLIGSTSKIDDMSKFEVEHVEQVWQYEASAQKWRGYSPDSATQKKISDKGFDNIQSIESWHGFWIKSKDEWVLTFASDENEANDNIILEQGWNLISLPIDSVVSPHIFDDVTLWKYTNDNQWEFFEKDSNESLPTISHITNSDGIWVKSNKDQNISVATNSAKLHNFSSIDEVKKYIKDMLITHKRPICGYYPMVMLSDRADSSSGSNTMDMMKDGVLLQGEEGTTSTSTSSASSTNVQVKGVDESDIVKHGEKNIFYVSNLSNSIGSIVNVTTFERIVSDNLNPSQQIQIYGEVNSLYLVEDRLIVLSNYNVKAEYYLGGMDDKIKDTIFENSILIDIFDVSNISNIQKVSTYKINGAINSSRVIDGKMFLVTNFHPYMRYTYPHKIYVDAPECKEYFGSQDEATDSVEIVSNTLEPIKDVMDIMEYKKYARCYDLDKDSDDRYFRLDYDRPEISYEYLIPYMQKDSQSQEPLISAKTFFAPGKKDQDPTITTVSMIDILDASLKKTSSVLGHNNTVYASRDSMYLVSSKYPIFMNFDRYEERSVLYKFLLDENLSYKATGFVNGKVLNQFSLDEYKDILRIATTEENSWRTSTKNSLYTLKDIDGSMLIQGVLSGLGHEGETIRSVRFMGDHAYIVTFRQTDPFYTIDLTNPSNPKKVGELKIDGFSAYLHPVDENYILGIGRDATPNGEVVGLKIELFDVSDFSNPTSADSYSFGTEFSYSDMLNNHKALAYRSSDKLFGFTYASRDYWRARISELGVFQIDGNAINAYKTIKSPNLDYNGFERGLIFDMSGKTYIAYFANGKIAYSLLDDLKE